MTCILLFKVDWLVPVCSFFRWNFLVLIETRWFLSFLCLLLKTKKSFINFLFIFSRWAALLATISAGPGTVIPLPPPPPLKPPVIIIMFHKIISFRIMNKITLNHKDNGLTITKLRRRYFSWKFPRFWEVILGDDFQRYLNREIKYFQIWQQSHQYSLNGRNLMTLS